MISGGLKMMRELNVLFVVVLLLLSIIIIIPVDLIIEANPSGGGDGDEGSTDLQLICEVTENLSNIIFDAYEDGELQKGRAFGSKGEHYAADYIVSLLTNI